MLWHTALLTHTMHSFCAHQFVLHPVQLLSTCGIHCEHANSLKLHARPGAKRLQHRAEIRAMRMAAAAGCRAFHVWHDHYYVLQLRAHVDALANAYIRVHAGINELCNNK